MKIKIFRLKSLNSIKHLRTIGTILFAIALFLVFYVYVFLPKNGRDFYLGWFVIPVVYSSLACSLLYIKYIDKFNLIEKKNIEDQQALIKHYETTSEEKIDKKTWEAEHASLEFKNFYKNLPEILIVPKNFIGKTNGKAMNEYEMTNGRKFFNEEEAFGLAAKFERDKKDGLICFNDKIGQLYYVSILGDAMSGHIYLNVRSSRFSHRWSENVVSFFRS